MRAIFLRCAFVMLTLPVSALITCAQAPPVLIQLPPASSAASRQAEPKRTETTAHSQGIEVETRYAAESLTSGLAPWQSVCLRVTKRFSPQQALWVGLNKTSRFALTDHEALIGFHQPLNSRWATLVELSVSPTHRVLPQWSALIQAERRFERGWVVQAGLRQSQYNTTRASVLIGSVEYYRGHWRTAYSQYAGWQKQAGLSASHLFQENYYYGERSSVGLSVALGRELTSLGTRGVLTTRVRGVSINGAHWFNARWAFNYSLTLHRQGELYTRRGGSFGIQWRF
ncbi:MAG: YaiO family outer membrane beta-barrel protein [Blastocatellia bacterium]